MTPSPAQLPLLDLDLLRTMVAIADTGNFSAAAEVVLRTPSAVSMQVKRIEDMIGRPVFQREARKVTLNPDGELLVAHARRVLALNREILSTFVQPEVSGIVRFGALDHAVDQFVPAALCRFADSHPGIRVDVMVENTDPLTERFLHGELDLAVTTCCNGQPRNEFEEVLMSEKLVWAGLKGGVAVERDPLPVSVWEEGCVWRKAAVEGLERSGRDYRINFLSAHVAGQKAGILADLVVAPLPASSCNGPIVALGPEHNLPPMPDYSLSLLVKKDAPPHVAAVADHLRAVMTRRAEALAA